MKHVSLKVAAVTGARGLIGRYIVEDLLTRGWLVRVLCRDMAGFESTTSLEVIVGDICQREKLEALLIGATVVFHCAAELHDESKMYDTNVVGTSYLLEVLRESSSVEYYCHLSSAGVVGPSVIKSIDESASCAPYNLYEKTKYEAEQLVFNADLDTNVCVLRPANVFDAMKMGVVQLAIRNTLKDRLLVWFRGNEVAHLVHAKDVSAVAIYLMDKELSKVEVFFLSYDQNVRNTVKGVYSYIRYLMTGEIVKISSLPSLIPYCFRILRRGKSLYGEARFSEEKLKETGFVFPLGFEDALKDVVKNVVDGDS